MPDHGKLINSRVYYEYVDPTTKKRQTSDQPPGVSGGANLPLIGQVGGSTPASTQYREQKFADGTTVLEKMDPETHDWVQVDVKQPAAVSAQAGGKVVKGPDGRQYRVDLDAGTMTPLEGQGPGVDPTAAKPGTVPAQENAQTAAARQQAQQDYQEGMLAARQQQLTQQQLTAAATAKHQQLQTMVALGQLEQKDADARMDRWKAGVEAGQAERRLAIEQQQTNIRAGELGVSRGQLGPTQMNAETNREQVVQSAASNAVDQTLKLLGQYTKVGPGFGAQFAAGLNTLSRGGGAMNVTPDAFMNPYVPDLNAIRQQAVTEAIDRLKGGAMAPATAAAVNQTSVPGAVTPAPVPSAPQQPPGQFTAGVIGQAAQGMGVLPGAPPAPPPVVPPYAGPVGQGGPYAPPQF